MPTITVKRSGRALAVPAGENLMSALMAGGLPVASSCHGDGICGKCGVIVEGAGGPVENALTPMSEDELGFQGRGLLPAGRRLSCQCRVLGDVVVDAPYW